MAGKGRYEHRREQDDRALNLRVFRVANNAKKENKSRSHLRLVTGND